MLTSMYPITVAYIRKGQSAWRHVGTWDKPTGTCGYRLEYPARDARVAAIVREGLGA